jgi:hypothetical protein
MHYHTNKVKLTRYSFRNYFVVYEVNLTIVRLSSTIKHPSFRYALLLVLERTTIHCQTIYSMTSRQTWRELKSFDILAIRSCNFGTVFLLWSLKLDSNAWYKVWLLGQTRSILLCWRVLWEFQWVYFNGWWHKWSQYCLSNF